MGAPSTRPLKITIDGVDVTESVEPVSEIEIEDVLTRRIDTVRLPVQNGEPFGISDLQEVIIRNPAGTVRYFGGLIESFERFSRGPLLDYVIAGVDFSVLLGRPAALVNAEYEGEDDSAIIADFMPEAAPEIEGVTYVKTVQPAVAKQQYPRMTPQEVLDALCGAAAGVAGVFLFRPLLRLLHDRESDSLHRFRFYLLRATMPRSYHS
jgi:hypothetical protein